MTTEGLPDGPDRDEMIQLIREAFPNAVVATIDSAAFFSLDDKHWPIGGSKAQRIEFNSHGPMTLAKLNVMGAPAAD